MNIGKPYADVITGARGELLAILVSLARPATIRELGRLADISSGHAWVVVDQLARAGLVRKTIAGRATMVVFNPDHLAADGIKSLMSMRGELVNRLSTEVGGWIGVAAAWLYGSTARGDGDASSDIDLLVVGSTDMESELWTAQVGLLRTKVEAWTGNVVQLSEYTVDSFRQLVVERNPLVAAIRQDGIELTEGAKRLLLVSPDQ